VSVETGSSCKGTDVQRVGRISGVASTNRPNILGLAADHCFPHHKTQRNTAGWEGK